MTKKRMTRDEEYGFYADPKNQTPQRPGCRRRGNLSEMVPVRFDPETLEALRAAADAEDRSMSSWIRRVVEHEVGQRTG